MKIVGICLIKNEDLYIKTVIRNVVHFCDELLVLDNYSTDNTFAIINQLKEEYSSIRVFQVKNTSDTHSFVEPYVGTNTWIFRVDGDEVYDVNGLNRLRKEIINGAYKDWFNITSSTIHVDKVYPQIQKVSGYEARMSALSNFSLLKEWHETGVERLHGVHKVFKNNFDISKMKLIISGTENFKTSYLRCLHLCFIRRSSLSKETSRINPSEKKHWFYFFINVFKNFLKGTIVNGVTYKNHAYRIGKRKEYLVDKGFGLTFFD